MNFQERSIYWEEPASEEEIAALVDIIRLPQEHLDFLRKSNGVEASLEKPPHEVRIWSSHDFLTFAPIYDDLINEVMEMPSMLAFGDNSKRIVFLYDRSTKPWKVVCCPRISLCAELITDVAPDFASLLELLGKGGVIPSRDASL